MITLLRAPRIVGAWQRRIRQFGALLSLGVALPLAGSAQTVILEQWPLTADAVPTITATGVTASNPTFLGLALSDGSTTSGSIGGYSVARGQAFSPDGTTGGGWPSGTLSRTIYEQFTVAAASGYTLRVDSLIFSSAFNNSANGRVGVSYSLNGFTNTSEVTGGMLPAGGSASSPAAQPATATGAFTTVAADATLVPNRTGGPTVNSNTYRLALNGAVGVAVAAGQTLSIRLYYALGSTSAIRQAQLKSVSAKGTSTAVAAPPCALATNLAVSNITFNSAQLSFTAPGTNTNYTVSTVPASTSQTVTTSPASLSGLAANTTYTVNVVSNCTGGASSTASTTFTTAAAPALNSTVLQRWLLTANDNDDLPSRSPNVTASTPTLSNMSASDGSVTGYTANSTTYGQATAPNADGTGWNGTIRTTHYEEFTTTATNGQLRLDSLILSAAFYSTSNGKLTVAYSTNGFATSTFIQGTQTAPSAVNNQGAGFTTFRMPLTANSSGVTLTNGQSIAFRLYFALGTSSSRYALLKNVIVKGEATPNCTSPTNFAVTNITSTTASVTFTPGAGNTGYTVTYTPANGSPVAVSPAPTASPISLTGLTPNTAYTVTLQSTCAAGQGGVLSTTFSTLPIPITSAALLQWPLQADLQDNTGTRSAAVVASPASMRRLQAADGSVASVPAYSTLNGLALAPTAQGGWSTSATPAASENVQTVNRKYYQQFVVTAAGNYDVRLDSLILTAAAYNSSNGRMAVVYSRSNFTLDSTDVAAGGKVVPGGALPAANYGSFSNVINLPNQTNGLSTVYRLPLTPTTAGITLAPGQTLTVRVYFGIGSTSAGRYALLRDVQVMGLGTARPLPVTLTRFDAVRQGSQAVLTWATASERNSKGFAVQVSADGREFRTAGFVPSAGTNSSQPQSYRFVDAPEAATGTRYYRLQQLDLDGTSTYTPARAVVFAGTVLVAEASPNPFSSELYLATQAATATRTAFTFCDATGRAVLTQQLDVPAGQTKLTLSGLSQLPKGLYILRFTLDGKNQHVKLMKE